MTVEEVLKQAIESLESNGVVSARLDAEVLLAEVTGLDRAALIASSKRLLTPLQLEQFKEFVGRRERREPVAYITGRRHFRSIELLVDPRVLIPRPETEHLVEAALELPSSVTVVDVGTGSGAVALALKHERPDMSVIAIDSSEMALQVARANAIKLRIDVEFRSGNLLDPLKEREHVDAIVSNPPYISESERAELTPEITSYEPALALFAGEKGLDVYSALIPQAAKTKAWFIALEVGAGQASAIDRMLQDAGFGEVEVNPDLAGIPRVVIGRR